MARSSSRQLATSGLKFAVKKNVLREHVLSALRRLSGHLSIVFPLILRHFKVLLLNNPPAICSAPSMPILLAYRFKLVREVFVFKAFEISNAPLALISLKMRIKFSITLYPIISAKQ